MAASLLVGTLQTDRCGEAVALKSTNTLRSIARTHPFAIVGGLRKDGSIHARLRGTAAIPSIRRVCSAGRRRRPRVSLNRKR
jgi:hypothetical protein